MGAEGRRVRIDVERERRLKAKNGFKLKPV
jgi:hypothetical protein